MYVLKNEEKHHCECRVVVVHTALTTDTREPCVTFETKIPKDDKKEKWGGGPTGKKESAACERIHYFTKEHQSNTANRIKEYSVLNAPEIPIRTPTGE